MVKNRTASGDIIVTDKGLEAFKTFGNLVDIRILTKGLRYMLNYALRHDITSEIWFEDFLEEYKILHDFADELEVEYGPPK